MSALFPEAIITTPDCDDDVVENMQIARDNDAHQIDDWTPTVLAENMVEGTGMDAPLKDIEKSIRIWRGRNKSGATAND